MSDIHINGGIIIINESSDHNEVNVVGNVEDIALDNLKPKEEVEGFNKEPEQNADRAGQIEKPSGRKRKIQRKPLWIILCTIIILAFWGICLIFEIEPLSESDVFIEAIKWLLPKN